MKPSRTYYVYIMTNEWNTVLYTGVTGDLIRRVRQHKEGQGGAFTAKYRVRKLVFFEATDNVQVAIAREKQIKGGSRKKKIALVESLNPEWQDLFAEIED